MQQEMFSKCESCGNGFYYTRVGLHSRPRQYCHKCLRAHKRAATRERVRRYRARKRAAAETAANSRTPQVPRPVAGCGREDVRATSPRGLYSDLPEPDRSTRRQEVGLP
jgi:hypothetical protein